LSRPVLLFGASGRLGRAVVSRGGRPLRRIAWENAKAWTAGEARAAVGDALDWARAAGGDGLDVVLASGLISPSCSAAEIEAGNVAFPLMVARAALAVAGVRCLTFGTILEHFADIAAVNRYVRSKRSLAAGLTAPGRLMHLRLHTLYGGGAPSPHMFTGQMAAALAARTPFAMTSGRQLREYHHVDDVAASMAALLDRDWGGLGASLDLSSGQPVALRVLAEAVFGRLGRLGDLRLGEAGEAGPDNDGRIFPRSPDWLLPAGREPVAGVCRWLCDCLEART
jgi:nucleoside-diphosphate-sugar epimerase